MSTPATPTPLAPEHKAEMERFRAYYPFRHVFGVYDENGAFLCRVTRTKLALNNAVKRAAELGGLRAVYTFTKN